MFLPYIRPRMKVPMEMSHCSSVSLELARLPCLLIHTVLSSVMMSTVGANMVSSTSKVVVTLRYFPFITNLIAVYRTFRGERTRDLQRHPFRFSSRERRLRSRHSSR